MEGGDLRWFWAGFEMFERIDHVRIFLCRFIASRNLLWSKVYSVKGYHDKAGFAPAAGAFDCNALDMHLISNL